MSKNKRIPIKWVRDLAKSNYKKLDYCEVCGTKYDLEFHHIYSLTLLFESWVSANNMVVDTDEDVLGIRQQFIDEHKKELYDDVLTLCEKHHIELHRIYGKVPSIASAEKQRNWVLIKNEEYRTGVRSNIKEVSGGFSQFYSSECTKFSKFIG